MNKQKNIIVIGSGFGGLSVAIRLLAKGHKVTILEKLPVIGGRGRIQEIEGFKFDSGPTVITIPRVLEELFAEADRELNDYVELLPVYPYYRVEFPDGTHFDYQNYEENLKQIEALSPDDVKRYEKMVKKIEPIYYKGFEELAFKPFTKLWNMIKIIPSMIKMGAYVSNYRFISKFVKNDKLRQVFSFHPLLIGGNPFSVPAIYSLIQYLENAYGIWYPKGGIGSLTSGMAQLIDELGGEIRLSTGVKRIIVDEGKVKGIITENNDTINADIVVSNADIANTYMRLIDPQYRKKNSDRRYKRIKYSMSLFLIYFGTSKRYEDVKHHTIIMGPRYKELLKDIFNRKILADDFSSYLHRPTATDQSIAPDGHDAFYILVPVPNLDGEVDWNLKKDEFKSKVLNYLEDNYLPDLKENIVVEKVFTPLDFQNTLGAYKGNGFSIQPTLIQSAYFRPHNRSEDIEGLYIVGAGTHPGAGVPGVISSAAITADLIAKDYN
ncbi:MAG: phytoene desaturase [Candidatus Heimdallarchaeota archaeon]|nr:phytoene desaturase [Candidatus Heimdallarchaeota archaeon]